MKIPDTMEKMDPQWFTYALQHSYPNAVVTSVERLQVIHGAATKIQVKLEYEGDKTDLPQTLWVKTGFEEHTPFMEEIGMHWAEELFYGTLAPSLNIPSAKCYYHKLQPELPNMALLLEDLCTRNARFGSALRPLTFEEAAEGVKWLATLHSTLWGPAARAETRIKPTLTWGEGPIMDEALQNAAPLFACTRGYAVPFALHDPARIYAAWTRYRENVVKGDVCLLHGDTHVGNCYVLPDGSVSFLDWQNVSIGHWSHDFSYFVVTALDAPVRRKHERALLALYLDTLRKNGVSPPEQDEAWNSYRKGIIFGFFIWLVNPDQFQPSAINTCCLARAGVAMIDHDVLSLIEEG
jgi:hypothetical protein